MLNKMKKNKRLGPDSLVRWKYGQLWGPDLS